MERGRVGSVGHTEVDALVGTYQEHERRLLTLCLAHLRDLAAAEDAVQETFLRAAPRLHGIDAGSVRPFLYAVARHVCREELRRQARQRRTERALGHRVEGTDPLQVVSDRQLLGRVWALLSGREQRVLVARFAGYSHDEVARRLGMSPGAVAVALSRARQRIRQLVGASRFGLAAMWGRRRRARRAGALPALPVMGGSWPAVLVLAAVVAAPGAFTRLPGASSVLDASTAVSATTAGGVLALDAVASPDVALDHTLYVVGSQRSCRSGGCAVLLRSTDDGRSWTRLPAAGFAGGAVLPAGRRAAALLFAMGPRGLQRSDDGGSTFHLVAAVAGAAAVVPDSPPNDVSVVVGSLPRLSVYHVGTGLLMPGAAMPPGLTRIDALDFAGSGDRLMVAGRWGGAGALLRCDRQGACPLTRLLPSDQGDPVLHLRATPGLVVLYRERSLYVSGDGGRTLTRVALPSGIRLHAAAVVPGHPSAVVVAADLHGDPVLLRWDATRPTVQTTPSPLGTSAWLLVLPSGRIVAAAVAPSGGGGWGIVCSADGGPSSGCGRGGSL